MDTTTDPILDLIPAGYKGIALAALVLIPILGRAYKALQNNGGLKGVWNAILFGTNTPKVLVAGLCLLGVTACGTLPDGTRTFLGLTGAQALELGGNAARRELVPVLVEARQARARTAAKNPRQVTP